MQKWNHFLAAANSGADGGARGVSDSADSGWDLEARASERGGRGPGLGSVRGLWHEEDGQTLVEYGLLIGLLALVIVAAVTLFGRRMNNNLYGTSNNVLPFNQ